MNGINAKMNSLDMVNKKVCSVLLFFNIILLNVISILLLRIISLSCIGDINGPTEGEPNSGYNWDLDKL